MAYGGYGNREGYNLYENSEYNWTPPPRRDDRLLDELRCLRSELKESIDRVERGRI